MAIGLFQAKDGLFIRLEFVTMIDPIVRQGAEWIVPVTLSGGDRHDIGFPSQAGAETCRNALARLIGISSL